MKATRNLLLALLFAFGINTNASAANISYDSTGYANAFLNFDYSTTSFSWKNAWLSMIMAKLAYMTNFSNDDTMAKAMGFTSYKVLKMGGSSKNIIVAWNSNMVFIASEGLDTGAFKRDNDRAMWHAGLKKSKEICPKCYLLKSFRNLAKSGYTKVKSTLSSNSISTSLPIYLGGHSFGGFASVYIGARLKKAGYNVKSIYTFGAPRLGNKKAVNKLKKTGIKVYRFISKNDYAANWPSQHSTFSSQIIYMRKKSVNTSKKQKKVKEAKKLAGKTFFRFLFNGSHDVSRYIKRVQKWAGKKTSSTDWASSTSKAIPPTF